MKTVTVIFDEPLHHVCLMHGLKQTYGRMPFLNKRVLEIREKCMMKNPSRRTSMRGSRNMIGVSYYRQSFDRDWRYAFGDIPSTLLKYLPKTDCDGKSSSSLIS